VHQAQRSRANVVLLGKGEHVDRHRLRQLIDRDPTDALPAYRIDRRVLVRKSDFDAYVANYRISGRPGVVAALKNLRIVS